MIKKVFIITLLIVILLGVSAASSSCIRLLPSRSLFYKDDTQVIWGYVDYSDDSWVPNGVVVTATNLKNNNSIITTTVTAGWGHTGTYMFADIFAIPGTEDGDTIRINISYGSCNGEDTVVIDVSLPSQQCDLTIYGNLPPRIPNQPSGSTFGYINTTYNYSTSTWDPDNDDIYYWFDWDDGNNSGWIGPYSSNETCNISYSWDEHETYQIKVKAKDEHGAELGTLWSEPLNVTIVISQPPNQPSDPEPEDDATDVDINMDLSWSCSDPDGDDLTYDVYFEANDPTPDNLLSNNQTSTTYDPGTMETDTHYYWKIVAWDPYGFSTDGPVWDFTTENNPPNTPSDPEPENGAMDVDVNMDLSWTCSDPDGDDLTFDVYFEADDPTPDILVSNNQSDTNYDPGTMEYDTHYYWQIIAWDEHGASTTGPIWDFTTGTEPNDPPYPPSDPIPYDGETDVDIDSTLSWYCDDPDDDSLTYEVYLDTVNPPINKVSDDQVETIYNPETLMFKTIYYWQIIAKDEHGASTTGPIWEFTTAVNNPPDKPMITGPTSGNPNKDYDFTFNTTDPDEDDVKYHIDWGDSSFDNTSLYPSGSDVVVSHSWTGAGSYSITAYAEDEYGSVGDETTFTITIKKSKSFNSPFHWLQNWLQSHPNLFPIIRQLLGLN